MVRGRRHSAAPLNLKRLESGRHFERGVSRQGTGQRLTDKPCGIQAFPPYQILIIRRTQRQKAFHVLAAQGRALLIVHRLNLFAKLRRLRFALHRYKLATRSLVSGAVANRRERNNRAKH